MTFVVVWPITLLKIEIQKYKGKQNKTFHYFICGTFASLFSPYYAGPATVPIRGAGDGMETKKTPAVVEATSDCTPTGPNTPPTLKVVSPTRSPKCNHSTPGASPQPLGVLHLGKVSRESCTEVEAMRIVVPRAAISRSSRTVPVEGKGEAGQQTEGWGSSPLPACEDWKGQMEKLQNSERRLLQDKEGLCNQLRVQTEVWIQQNTLFVLFSIYIFFLQQVKCNPVFDLGEPRAKEAAGCICWG